MPLYVLVAGALLPEEAAAKMAATCNTTALATRLQYGRVTALTVPDAGDDAHWNWLWVRFGGRGMPVTAPYALRALQASRWMPGSSICWAEPVHFALARDHVLVHTLGAAPLTVAECLGLAAEATAAACEHGAQLIVAQAKHWFISFNPPWSLRARLPRPISTHDAQDALPDGPDAMRWRRLLTDIQMRWHRLPLNEAREADGRPTVNGLWLYGGGLWQPLAARPFAAVAADDLTVRGWALASGLDCDAVTSANALPAGAADAETLLYRDDLAAAFHAQDWAAWASAFATLAAALDALLAQAFACGHREVTLLLAGRKHLRAVAVRPGDRLRLWRRNSMACLLAEGPR
ncbi:MAG: hypothetical protein N2483_06600 [Burkholderiaceae bacterium]|nr:hypothetical protein [Burkholderiaceae bacterium]